MSIYYAQIDDNGIVRGISQLSNQINQKNLILIESYDESLLGKKWNGTSFDTINNITSSNITNVMASTSAISQSDFLRRFTSQERIEMMSSTDPVIKDFVYILSISPSFQLTDSDIVEGVQYLKTQNILTEERANQILSVG